MDSILMCGYSVHRQYRSPHNGSGTQHYSFRLQTHGEIDAKLNGEDFVLKKGDLLTLAPGDVLELKKELHSEDPADTSSDYYLLCGGEWVANWYREIGGRKLTRVPPNEAMLELWRLLIREMRRSPKDTDQEFLEHLLRTFCLSVKRLLNDRRQGETDFIVSRMRHYIEDHAVERLKIAEVAAHVGLSESRAIHLFKEMTGQSMVDYLTQVRLNSAVEQMKYTDAPLELIAENTGFGSYAYFHRVFRRARGISPGQFRRDYREDAEWSE